MKIGSSRTALALACDLPRRGAPSFERWKAGARAKVYYPSFGQNYPVPAFLRALARRFPRAFPLMNGGRGAFGWALP
jgi:hypothetical protein